MAGFQNDAGVTQQEAGFGYVGKDGRLWTESFRDNLVALAGGGRTGATKLDSMFNRVATVATAADSVVLPPIASFLGGGLAICVINDSSNAMQVFADGSDTVNGVAGATGISQMPKSVVYYQMISASAWVAQGLGSGYSGAQQTYSFQDGMTAHAGGGQASATVIGTSTARFTTVASAGDSAVLMAAAPGLIITVINAGASILNVFPNGSDQINSLGASNAFAVPAGGVAEFFTTATGVWHTVLSGTGAPQQAYNTNAATATATLTGANITGGTDYVFLDLTGTLGGAGNAQLPTVAQLVAAMTVAGINPQPGMTYFLEMCERSAANTWTVTTNTGWTLNGTMTLGASGLTRRFIVALTSLSAATLRSVGTYTLGAA